MKVSRFLFSIALCVGTTLVSFAQDKFVSAISKTDFVEENAKGVFLFTFPNDISAKDVALSAEYYTMYFTVDFNEKNHEAKITMKDSADLSKRIIGRLFVSLSLREIQYNGNSFTNDEFFLKYLKSKE